MSCYAPRGNSVGVAFPQPRVEVRSASTLGVHTKKECNAVSVAISRRRYLQQDNIGCYKHKKPWRLLAVKKTAACSGSSKRAMKKRYYILLQSEIS